MWRTTWGLEHRITGHTMTKSWDVVARSCARPGARAERWSLNEKAECHVAEFDWCLRARRHGLPCRVLGRALVRHEVSVTSGIRGSDVLTPRSAYTHATGSVLIGPKHYRGAAAYGFLLGLLAIRIPYNSLRMAMGWPACGGTGVASATDSACTAGPILGVHGVDDHAGAERSG